MRRLLAAVMTLPLTLPLLAACGSDDGPDPATVSQDDFKGGTCLVLAPDVLGVRTFALDVLKMDPENALPPLGTDASLPGAAARLRQGESRAGSQLLGPLRDLVAAIEDVTGRLDSNTYDSPRYMQRVRDTADAVIGVCT